MSFDVRVAGPAARYLSRLSEPAHSRVLARLDQIAADPYGRHTKPLQGGGGRRGARVGGLRIVSSSTAIGASSTSWRSAHVARSIDGYDG
ncbi:MAG: hypothetical protein M3069_30430 [Chloroflexota bacterium]|nr:hypothetical protein [Chloroflexota bacterium]